MIIRWSALLLILVASCCLNSCQPGTHITYTRVNAQNQLNIGVYLARRGHSTAVVLCKVKEEFDLAGKVRFELEHESTKLATGRRSGEISFVFDNPALDPDERYLLAVQTDNCHLGYREIRHFRNGWSISHQPKLVIDDSQWSSVRSELARNIKLLRTSQWVGKIHSAAIEDTLTLSGFNQATGGVISQSNRPEAFHEIYAVESGTATDFAELERGIRSGDFTLVSFSACPADTPAGFRITDPYSWRRKLGAGNDLLVIVNLDLSMRNENTEIRSVVRYRIDDNGNMSEVPIPGAPQK